MSAITVNLWHSDDGCKTVLVKRGLKNLHLLVQSFPVHVEKRPLTEERYLTPLDYPLARAARRFREFARRGNATKAALAMLREATP